MNLQVYKKFKSIFGCLLIIGLLFAGPTYALQQDSVATDSVETTVEGEEAVTTEEAASEEGAATSEEGSAAAPAASPSAAAATADEGSTIAPQVYKNFFYYVLLFLVICAVTAVIGKIHSVYVLTRKMNGTYDPLENNNFQSFMLFLFLFFFLWGTYYSFDVWGSWAWRDAVTEHGKDVDTMFIITTTLTTAVLVIMHILIFTFTLIYRQRKDRSCRLLLPTQRYYRAYLDYRSCNCVDRIGIVWFLHLEKHHKCSGGIAEISYPDRGIG